MIDLIEKNIEEKQYITMSNWIKKETSFAKTLNCIWLQKYFQIINVTIYHDQQMMEKKFGIEYGTWKYCMMYCDTF